VHIPAAFLDAVLDAVLDVGVDAEVSDVEPAAPVDPAELLVVEPDPPEQPVRPTAAVNRVMARTERRCVTVDLLESGHCVRMHRADQGGAGGGAG
jgi:hypothetical protein